MLKKKGNGGAGTEVNPSRWFRGSLQSGTKRFYG